MYKYKSSKKTLFLLVFISLAFFAVLYFLYRDIRIKNEHISSLSQDIELQFSDKEYLLTTGIMIKEIDPDVVRINNSIVSSGGDVDFIENLEGIARSNGLTISIDSLDFEDSPTLSSGGMTAFKIRAITEGSWSGTYTFISQIESLPFKIKINRFSFLGVKKENTSGNVGVSIPVIEWHSSFEIIVLKYK